NYIVWEDYRNSPSYDPLKNPDIYGVDISNLGNEIAIASEGVFDNSTYVTQLYPFGGEKAVWMDYRDGNWNIYFYDFLNPVANGIQITSDSSKQTTPAISGNRIVWEDKRNGEWDIYTRTINPDNSLGIETAIVTALGSQSRPRIDSNRVVWIDYRNGWPNSDIYLYDFSNPVANGTAVVSDLSVQTNPAISGNRIVWQDYRNGNADIYMRTINSNGTLGAETQVTTDSYAQINPAIYGNIIVWEDYRTGSSNIYLYNISTGIETPLTSGSYYHMNPAIYDNKVVWADGRNGGYIDQFGPHNSDIYLAYIDVPNQNPTANAGVDQTVNEGTTVNLSGSGTDSDGDTLSYNWTQTQGPSVTLNNPNIAAPSFTAPEVTADTTLTFQLTVNDGKGGTAIDAVNVAVKNIASIQLYKGWNSIALPINPSTPLTAQSLLDLINPQGGDVTQIAKWDKETQSWIIHINNLPINNFEIKPGEGYFIKSNKNSQFNLTGTSISSSIQISFFKNWNLAGVPYPVNKYTAQTLLDEINSQGGNATLIAKWDKETQSWIININNIPIIDF
ncbi:MAG: hypothetical protein HY776_00160, partial [Actinobacteria bacterium]|nr:hypothetical protein [Actinomycetota bacterium]